MMSVIRASIYKSYYNVSLIGGKLLSTKTIEQDVNLASKLGFFFAVTALSNGAIRDEFIEQ